MIIIYMINNNLQYSLYFLQMIVLIDKIGKQLANRYIVYNI